MGYTYQPLVSDSNTAVLNKAIKTSRSRALMIPNFTVKTWPGWRATMRHSSIFVQRRDPKTKQVKVVPEMAYPLEANRKPVPKHELLENDWRETKFIWQNYLQQVRGYGPKQVIHHTVQLPLVSAVHGLVGQYAKLPQLLNIQSGNEKVGATSPLTYQSSKSHPPGYFYRRFKPWGASVPKQKKEGSTVPRVVIDDPFQRELSTLDIGNKDSLFAKDALKYDPDVLVGLPVDKETLTYGQMDAMPDYLLHTDFKDPLSSRAMKEVRYPKTKVENVCNFSRQWTTYQGLETESVWSQSQRSDVSEATEFTESTD